MTSARPPARSVDIADTAGQRPATPESRPRGRRPAAADALRHRTAGPRPAHGDAQPRDAAKRGRKAPWWELPALVALAIVIAILVKTFLVQPFYIPSESMEKTLHGCPGCSGDRILVNKPIYYLGILTPVTSSFSSAD